MTFDDDPHRVSLYKEPVVTLWAFGRAIRFWILSAYDLLWEHRNWTIALFGGVGAIFAVLGILPEEFEDVAEEIVEFVVLALYWGTLGVLSSVGLGAGLHTFFLYLAPHVLRVTAAAVSCGSTEFERGFVSYLSLDPVYRADAFVCPSGRGVNDVVVNVSFWDVLWAVLLPSVCWGVGTAIGELPPFFIAKASAEAEKRMKTMERRFTVASQTPLSPSRERLREVNRILDESEKGILDRAKRYIVDAIRHPSYGFWSVFLAASVPNPLFDLAGLTCGSLGIPWRQFFVPTLLGKALIKAPLQVSMYVMLAHPTFRPYLPKVILPPHPCLRHLDALFGWKAVSAILTVPSHPNHSLAQSLASQLASNASKPDVPDHVYFTRHTHTCRQCCHADMDCVHSCNTPEKPSLSSDTTQVLWHIALAFMLLYFVYTAIETAAQEQIAREALSYTPSKDPTLSHITPKTRRAKTPKKIN